MKQKNIKLPLFLSIITLITVLALIVAKIFFVNSGAGEQRIDELIHTFTAFFVSVIITLLFSTIKKDTIANRILTVILLIINIYLGVIFVNVYYENIDKIINKLLYLTSTNTIEVVNVYAADNSFSVIINVISILLIIISITSFVIIMLQPLINKITLTIEKVVITVKEEIIILIQNISKGFLYKRVP